MSASTPASGATRNEGEMFASGATQQSAHTQVPQTHYVKCWPEFFERILDGSKTFEVRKDDRGYQEGDGLVLSEYDPLTSTFTGRAVRARVGYVLRDYCAAIPDFAGHVVFSVHEVVVIA